MSRLWEVIDLKTLRDDPESVRESQRIRGEDPALVDRALDADARRRAAVAEADNLRAEQKSLGKLVGKAAGEEKAQLLARGKELADLVGPGDAEWADWRADRLGLECARTAPDDAAVDACCVRLLAPPRS